MIEERQQQLGTFLQYLAEALDVPENLRRDAKSKYDHIGKWVKEDSQRRFRTDSEVYPQGSVRLGTMIQPVKDEDDYDIDLVYRRNLVKEGVTQQGLKNQVGEQIRQYAEQLRTTGQEVPTLEEGRRCWTLRYGNRFHMDVLPSIPDDEAEKNNVRERKEGILITDKELRLWKPSNPRGYANWFDEQNRVLLVERREAMAKAASVEIEEIPVEVVKTPMRRVVQLLKRHRDQRYEGHPDDKPISVIITTLAAKAYGGETNPYEAFMSTVRKMTKHIERRNGVYWVENPVNPNENFADRWEEYPERAARFFEWLAQIEHDIRSAAEQRGIHKVAGVLASAFGERVVTKAASRFGNAIYEQREAGSLRMAAGTGILGAAGQIVKGHTFFGARIQDKKV